MIDVMKLLERVDEHMREYGHESTLTIDAGNFTINRKEVIIRMPYVMTVTIPREEFEGTDTDVSQAVSRAISHAVSLKQGHV